MTASTRLPAALSSALLFALAACGGGATVTTPAQDAGTGTPPVTPPATDGGSTPPSQGADAGPAPGADAAAPLPSTPDAGSSGSYALSKQYVGTYVAKITSSYTMTAGALGSMNIVQSSYGNVVLADDPAHQVVTLTETGCHIDVTSTGTGILAGGSITVPDIVVTSSTLAPATFAATSSGGTTTWSTSEIRGPSGWHWASPTDTLPTTSSDSRVFDQDNDSHPGVTIKFASSGLNADVYVVELQRTTVQGTGAPGAKLVGTDTDLSEQNVIGSSNPLVPSGGMTRTPGSTTANNGAQIVKVASPMTCADLMAKAGTLFN